MLSKEKIFTIIETLKLKIKFNNSICVDKDPEYILKINDNAINYISITKINDEFRLLISLFCDSKECFIYEKNLITEDEYNFIEAFYTTIKSKAKTFEHFLDKIC